MDGGVICCLYSSVCRKAEASKVHQSQRTKWSAISSDNRHLKPVVTEVMDKAYSEAAKHATAYVLTDTPVY